MRTPSPPAAPACTATFSLRSGLLSAVPSAAFLDFADLPARAAQDSPLTWWDLFSGAFCMFAPQDQRERTGASISLLAKCITEALQQPKEHKRRVDAITEQHLVSISSIHVITRLGRCKVRSSISSSK